ncbi:MAG: ABC transporter permease [Gemmatimonadota bacterium]|nr:ABC transporter permease [Gemmatimonadota bacterium]
MDIADSLKRETGRAIRSLARTPGFTLIVVLTLALGIGATTAIFTMLDRVVLHALPYADADRLVWLDSPVPGIGPTKRWGLSTAGFFYFQKHAHTLESVAAVMPARMIVTGMRAAERVPAVQVSASIFEVLRLRPLLGRAFTQSDNLPNAQPVVLVGYDYWKTRLDGAPNVVGSIITVNTVPMQVIGVMSRDATIPDVTSPTVDLWIPAELDPSARAENHHYLPVVARLATGATPTSAQAELAQITKRFPALFPTAYTERFLNSSGFTTAATPLRTQKIGDISTRLWILLGAVALVLLIACGNVANLFLVRAEARQREIAIRSALGAGRGNLAWHYFTETMLLALVGGAAALALAAAGVHMMVALAPSDLPRMAEVHLGWPGVLFTVTVAIAAGALFGTLTLLAADPDADSAVLREGGRGMTSSRRQHFTRGVLVAAQTALALVLLAAAGLMLQSFRNLRNVSPGFDPSNTLTAEVSLPAPRYATAEAVEAFYHGLLSRAATIPGVHAVGAGEVVPLGPSNNGTAIGGFTGCSGIAIEEPGADQGKGAGCIGTKTIAPGYFSALGIRVRGIEPSWSDVESRTAGVVVTKALAERLWPKQDAVGKGIKSNGIRPPFYRVVGVSDDIRGASLSDPPTEQVFFPLLPIPKTYLEGPVRTMTVLLRTNGVPPETLTASLRRILNEMDPDVPLGNVRSMDAIVARSMIRLSFTMTLLGIAAAMALILSAIGIYGVISYIVGRRRGEIGIRIALGAHASRVGTLVVRQSVQFAVIGIVIGIMSTLLITRVLSSVLFGVSPTDPVTLIVVSVIMLLIAILASYVPAQRAMNVDPVEALRAD